MHKLTTGCHIIIRMLNPIPATEKNRRTDASGGRITTKPALGSSIHTSQNLLQNKELLVKKYTYILEVHVRTCEGVT